MLLIKSYDLQPVNSQKSFYHKAIVKCYDNGVKILQSYNTDVMMQDADGKLHALWSGWSATTGKHIKAFCGLNKAGYMALFTE